MWLITIFSSIIPLGSYFFFDVFSIYYNDIITTLHISNEQYGILLSLTSLPNIIMCLFSSFIINRLGERLISLICNSIILASVCLFIIFLIFYTTINYIVVAILMFIMGILSETIYIIQSTMLVVEIPKKRLSLAMSVSSSILKLGSFISFLTIVPISDMFNSYLAGFWYTLIVCVICFIVNLLYYFHPTTQRKKDNITRWSWIDITKLNTTYYLLTFIFLFAYNPIFLLKSYGIYLVSQRDNISLKVATWYFSIFELIPIVLMPVIGIFIKANTVRWLLTTSIVLFIVGYIVTIYQTIVGILILGLAITTITSTIWPYLSYSIKSKNKDIGFSLLSSLSNLLFTVLYPLGGYILNFSDPLLSILVLNSGLAISALIIDLFLEFYVNACI